MIKVSSAQIIWNIKGFVDSREIPIWLGFVPVRIFKFKKLIKFFFELIRSRNILIWIVILSIQWLFKFA